MRYRLRTLLILMAVGPPMLALVTVEVAVPFVARLWPTQPVGKDIFTPLPTGIIEVPAVAVDRSDL